VWCGGHWSRRKAEYRPRIAADLAAVAAMYQVDPNTVLMSLADESGFVRVRRTMRPYCRIIWNENPVTIVERITADDAPWQRAHLQLAQISTALWGFALRTNTPLRLNTLPRRHWTPVNGYPRDAHHHPDEVPWGVVRWMEQDARAFQHIRKTGLRLREYVNRHTRRESLASQRLTWLMQYTIIPDLPVQRGPLLPPRYDAKRTA